MGLALLLAVICIALPQVSAAAAGDRAKRDASIAEYIRALMEQLVQSEQENQQYKRAGIDMGFHRGYSGNQVAKHLLGLAAANYEGGPGKRR
ncbi:PREDICTED: diuretic hormone class 2-like [Priapulus caudatus]|uniref:Diuretic hormone class 2-like n=1 Tax=Priapulus caudatus TaxID=37621 RepID=A0ABM1EXR5_PRICU|nr:PREDICTED: diuretic hormone class 2-like [Priapulus caudatus]